jgi:acyl-CoA thioester hydrolase
VFSQESDTPAAVGGFTHVFVDRISRKSAAMAAEIKSGLQRLESSSSGTRNGSKL